MNKLYIIRHGKTNWNVLHLMQGRTDTKLNEEGIRQAKKIKDILPLDKIDACFSSPLERTRKTAEIITDNKIDIIYDDLLIERAFGSYEGTKTNISLLEKHWNYNLNDKENNIESIQECLSRAKKIIDKINDTYDNKTILIVSHACLIKALHFNIIGYNENTNFLSFVPQNAQIYEYNIDKNSVKGYIKK